jgi:hypothetical protein
VARDRDQRERREDGGQREQQREARRQQRSEGDDEDDQRHRDREQARLPEVVEEQLLGRLDLAGVAELADEEARMGGLRGGDVVEDRGERTFSTSACFETRATTSSIAAVKAGSLGRSERLWIRTLSPAGCLKPASRIRSARPDSPGPAVTGSMLFVVTRLPIANATTTKASHPNAAVFQCAALQRPMRAAMLLLRGIFVSFLGVEVMTCAMPRP